MPSRNQHQQSAARNDASLRLEDLNTQVSRSGDLVHFCIFYNAIIIVFMTGPPYWCCHFDAVLFQSISQDRGMAAAAKSPSEDIVEYVSSKPDLDFLGVAWRQGETCETVARGLSPLIRYGRSRVNAKWQPCSQHETSPGKDRKCKHELYWIIVMSRDPEYALYIIVYTIS